MHFTPKHGSWLNIAEIERSVLLRQCLSRRIGDLQTLHEQVDAWCNHRNQRQRAPIDSLLLTMHALDLNAYTLKFKLEEPLGRPDSWNYQAHGPMLMAQSGP